LIVECGFGDAINLGQKIRFSDSRGLNGNRDFQRRFEFINPFDQILATVSPLRTTARVGSADTSEKHKTLDCHALLFEPAHAVVHMAVLQKKPVGNDQATLALRIPLLKEFNGLDPEAAILVRGRGRDLTAQFVGPIRIHHKIVVVRPGESNPRSTQGSVVLSSRPRMFIFGYRAGIGKADQMHLPRHAL
jgi:hypothetical protein